MTRTLIAAAIGAASALAATSALAAEQAAAGTAPAAQGSASASASSSDAAWDTTGLTAGLLVGYNISSVGSGSSSFNPYGVGLGARVGYGLPMDMGPGHLYLGGTFVYNLGGSVDGISYHVLYFGVEAGYELMAGPVSVRPYIGLGDASFTAGGGSETVDGVTINIPSASSSAVYFAPGVTALYPLTSNIAVGGDLRYLIASSNGTSINDLGIFLTGVYHF